MQFADHKIKIAKNRLGETDKSDIVFFKIFDYVGLDFFPVPWYSKFMTQETYTTVKPYTIDELITEIYEDNYSHIEFIDNMNGGDCDCAIHLTMATILKYWTV